MGKGFCPFPLAAFAGLTAGYLWWTWRQEKKEKLSSSDAPTDSSDAPESSFQVVFVLGAPGSGKGTQCTLLTQHYPAWAHLSAGDLLRAERNSGNSDLSRIINEKIGSGQIVPSSITVQLLINAMNASYKSAGKTKFLIDGFPRSQGNLDAWNELCADQKMEFVLFMDCPEELLVGRLLERGKSSGRVDDNMEVIRKRFHTFQEESLPIVQFYEKDDKVRTIVADKSVEDVYKQVSAHFENL